MEGAQGSADECPKEGNAAGAVGTEPHELRGPAGIAAFLCSESLFPSFDILPFSLFSFYMVLVEVPITMRLHPLRQAQDSKPANQTLSWDSTSSAEGYPGLRQKEHRILFLASCRDCS